MQRSAKKKFSILFIIEQTLIEMEHINLPKDLVFTLIEGQLYLEHSEALKYLGIPRTNFNRMVEKLSLLEADEVTTYKNRKLLKYGFVCDFWKRVSAKKWGR